MKTKVKKEIEVGKRYRVKMNDANHFAKVREITKSMFSDEKIYLVEILGEDKAISEGAFIR